MVSLKCHWRRWGGLLGCVFLLAGCLSVPLGDPEKSTVDNKLVGWWQPTDAGQGEHGLISVQAYDPRSYLIIIYSYTQDGATITPKGTMMFKAWLTPVANTRFLTMQLMNPRPANATDPEKDRYSISRVEMTDGGWSARTVSDDFLKDCATSEALRQKITDNVNNDALYGDKAATYQKAGDELTESVTKAFN